MRVLPLLALMFVAGSSSALVPSASAQVLQGKVPLQLRTAFFQLDSRTFSYPDGSMDRTQSTHHVGFSPSFGISAGYVLREYLTLTLLSAFAKNSTEHATGEGATWEVQTSQFEVLPGVRISTTGPAKRFFAGVGVGYARESTAIAGDEETGGHSALISLNLGIHAFVHEHVSIDPMVELTRAQGKHEQEIDSVTYYDQTETTTTRAKMTGYRFMFAVGLTGWL